VRIRIPGLRGGAGGEEVGSEAAVHCQWDCCTETIADGVLMLPWVSLRVVDEARGLFVGFCAASGVMVEVDDDREKVFASGARCVSLSFFVSFHDIVVGGGMELCLSSLDCM
jgi:hypothetical protein